MRIAIAFTGGKDSSLVATALQLVAQGRSHELPPSLVERLAVPQGSGDVVVAQLVTFVPAGAPSFKAHPLAVIAALAKCLQVPHVVKEISGPDYLASYITAIRELAADHQIDALATGDILDVCSNFMGRAAEGAGMPLLRPLWGIPRMELLEHLWALGMEPVVTCVNVTKFKAQPTANDSSTTSAGATAVTDAAQANAPMVVTHGVNDSASENAAAGTVGGACHGEPGASAPGRPSDDAHFSCMPRPALPAGSGDGFLMDPVADLLGHALTPELHARVVLPASQAFGVDACGELGEFHTMCVDGPTYTSRLEVVADRVHVQGEEYAYLLPSSVVIHAKA